MRKYLYALIALLLFSQACYAQTVITLKSGTTVEGALIERNDQYVKIDFSGVPVTYWIDEVESIRLEDGTTVTPAAQAKQEAPAVLAQYGQQEPAAGLPASGESNEYTQSPPPVSSFQETENAEAQESGNRQVNAFLPLGIAFGFALLFGLAFYVFFAICLQKIAQKTNTPNAWFAWIPVANLILMCDIAGKPRWWAALFLLGLIPYVGFIATTVVGVIINMKICERLGKPAWWGIITIIPLASFVIYGLLAFGSREQDNIVPYEPKASGTAELPAQSPVSTEPTQENTYEQNQ